MKQKPISELESQVMDIVWVQKSCTIKEVQEVLKSQRDIAYTTVATILHRLEVKGLVNKETKKGIHIYTPVVTKENYSKNLIDGFFKKNISSFGDAAIASFAENIDKLPDEKRRYFLELLDKHDKNK